MTTPQEVYAELPGRGLTLHYRDWGGDGTPIVLLHGLASGARIWDFTARLLAPRFRVIAADQRGHGLSGKPENEYGFDAVTADLGALIERVGLERPVLVGHSWGGAVVMQFAADYPESARGIVLVDGGFGRMSDDTPWERAEEMMRPPDIDGTDVERFVGFMQNWPDVKDNWSDELEEMVLSYFEVRDGKIYRRLPIPRHMLIARAIWEQRDAHLWDRIKVAALLIPALKEPTNERESHWYAAKMRGAEEAVASGVDVRVLPMENTIHDVPIQRPVELADAIAEFAESVAS